MPSGETGCSYGWNPALTLTGMDDLESFSGDPVGRDLSAPGSTIANRRLDEPLTPQCLLRDFHSLCGFYFRRLTSQGRNGSIAEVSGRLLWCGLCGSQGL